jgi:hypothetical protein
MKKVDVAHQTFHRTDDLRQALLAFGRRSCQTLARSGTHDLAPNPPSIFPARGCSPCACACCGSGPPLLDGPGIKGGGWFRGGSLQCERRGFGAVLSPGAIRPDLSFRVEGEQLWVGEKTAAALIVPSGKEASMSAGHESCRFRWGNSGGRPGLFIDATSTYVGPGSPPSTSSEFVPLQ